MILKGSVGEAVMGATEATRVFFALFCAALTTEAGFGRGRGITIPGSEVAAFSAPVSSVPLGG